MKKFLFTAIVICLCAVFLGGCKKEVDYFNYVSEKRDNIYLYSDDNIEIKVYSLERENPYSADGIKGDITSLCEVYVRLPKNYDEVEIKVGGVEGEMNYKAVTLTYDNKSTDYTAASVLYDGVISCRDAVKCVIEHANDLFKSLTDGKIFTGEIYVRLLFDDGCYYYVGVCDRNKKITAFLVDGERGKVIASHEN